MIRSSSLRHPTWWSGQQRRVVVRWLSGPPQPRVRPPSIEPASIEPASSVYARIRDRTPVSWQSLFLVGVVAASAVAYFKIERERRLERAMGKVVSSESDERGWSPRPGYLAPRKFVPTKWGWFPREDGFGARESCQQNEYCCCCCLDY